MPKLHQAMPVLTVADVAVSAAWYEAALRFRPGPFYGDPPAFCIVGRDGASIALDRLKAPGPLPLNQYWAVYLYIDDIDAEAAALRDRGIDILRGPEETFYGMREVDIRDPDGHIICLGQDMAPPDSSGA